MTKLTFRNFPKRYALRHPQSLYDLQTLRAVFPYTMIRYSGLWQMRELVKRVVEQKISGALVEMGCWKGGCGAYMACTSKKLGDPRSTWLFDSFEGLPEATPEDGDSITRVRIPVRNGEERKSSGILMASEVDVKEVAKRVGVEDQVHVVKGWFQDSLPRTHDSIGPIAVLRLDGDMYESTKCCLESLYDQVVPGGCIVIDDYKNWPGCRLALYEFFATKKIAPFLHGEPGVAPIYFIKE